jgi:hypothetical protein
MATRKIFFVISFLFLYSFSFAQSEKSIYDHHELFSPNFYPSSVNEYRTSDGQPGPKYWTNKASYKIAATLDAVKDAISGSVTITYVNNSPKPMDFIWLYLDQNLYRLDSRGQAKTPATGRSRYGDVNSTFEGGFTIQSVKLISNDKGKSASSDISKVISDTRMQLRLASPLAANGGTIKLKID